MQTTIQQPTIEQQAILDAFPLHHILKINAVAGSGKSSTLRMLSEANIMPSLYVCFNKANATEAAEKFPSHVACRTMHSLAFSAFGRNLMHKLASGYKAGEPYVNKGRSNTEIAKLYGIPDLRTSEDTMVTSKAIAGLVKLTVGRYQNSASKEIVIQHIPTREIMDIAKAHQNLDLEKFRLIILNFSKRLWADRINVDSPVQAEHDTYLKLWQLSDPVLNYEVIYVDEAQDTNPVCLDILKKQKTSKMVYVGDSYQSIYAFRQAVNAMETIQAPFKVLSKSFRYGKEIADLATFIIKGGIHVKGLETINSKLGFVTSKQYTEIFRTNAGLISRAVSLIMQGVKVYCNIDTRKFENQLNSALALFEERMQDVKDDDISLYSSWDELLESVRDVPELKRIAEIVEAGETYKYLKALKQVTLNKSSYDVLLTTAHKSKGMEWDNVIISDDFAPKPILCNESDEAYNQQEVNLFYVACTRAIKTLQIPADFYGAYMKHKRAMDFDPVSTSLEVGNVKMVHLTGNDRNTLEDLCFNEDGVGLNTMVRQVNAGVGIKLATGGIAFPDEEWAEEEIRAHYTGG